MKKIIMLISAFLFSAVLFAQSADKISEILASDKATYGQVSYLAATAMGLVDEKASYEDAFNVIKEKGLVANGKSCGDTLNLKQLSAICRGTWKIKGSLMIKTGAPRYVFKQMVADEIYSLTDDPMDVPDGRKTLAVISDCIMKYKNSDRGEKK